jgi:hypothetical protein
VFDAWPAELVHAEYVVVKVITTNLAFVFKEGFRKLLQLRLSLEINRTKKNGVWNHRKSVSIHICVHHVYTFEVERSNPNKIQRFQSKINKFRNVTTLV